MADNDFNFTPPSDNKNDDDLAKFISENKSHGTNASYRSSSQDTDYEFESGHQSSIGFVAFSLVLGTMVGWFLKDQLVPRTIENNVLCYINKININPKIDENSKLPNCGDETLKPNGRDCILYVQNTLSTKLSTKISKLIPLAQGLLAKTKYADTTEQAIKDANDIDTSNEVKFLDSQVSPGGVVQFIIPAT
jgi:hypothetical protein